MRSCERLRWPRLARTSLLLGSGLLGAVVSVPAADRVLERHLDDRYHVLVEYSGSQMQRHVWSKFPIPIELTGSDGRVYTMRQPFELYAETRQYGPADQLATAYDDAYAALVANGDCMPIYAGFREASFDCGERQGMRTVALRSDPIGDHLSTEMVASALIPDEGEFTAARTALDELTQQMAASAPRDAMAPLNDRP